jgi:hypothetical protein
LQDLQDNVRGLSRCFSAEAHRSMEVAAKKLAKPAQRYLAIHRKIT